MFYSSRYIKAVRRPCFQFSSKVGLLGVFIYFRFTIEYWIKVDCLDEYLLFIDKLSFNEAVVSL
jgi:hypothetical protein